MSSNLTEVFTSPSMADTTMTEISSNLTEAFTSSMADTTLAEISSNLTELVTSTMADTTLTEESSQNDEIYNGTASILQLQSTTETIMSSTLLSEVSDLDILKENMNVFFLILMGIIIFLMQAGFALLEAGSVRSKNTTNILLKNMLDVFICGIVYWIFGYPLAYGEGNAFLGHTGWASYGVSQQDYAYWFFQFVFAATTATIVSGAMAERCDFGAYLIYSAVLTGFVYPIVSHWAWAPSGWLANGHYHDFAGSGVVHLTGGCAAFVGCVCLGPRIGRFGHGGKRIEGHSLPLAALGGFILLFGFLAFNGGSQGSISEKGDAEAVATAIINTVISGSSAAIIVLIFRRFSFCSKNGTWSFSLTLNAALTGMVSACAGCNVLFPWGSLITGIIAGPLYLGLSSAMELFEIDDPLDAVAVHAGGGLWGLVTVALFKPDGIFFAGENAGQTMGWNLAGALSIILWTGVICTVMFGSLKYFGWLRVPTDVELKGLDMAKHGEAAYPAEAWHEEQYINNNNNNNNLPLVMSGSTSKKPSSLRKQFRQSRDKISFKKISIFKSSPKPNTPSSLVNESYRFDTENEVWTRDHDTENEIMTRDLPDNETT